MSTHACSPCPSTPPAAPRQRARTAEEAAAFKEEILAQTAERRSQKAAVLAERQGRTGRAALGSGMAQWRSGKAPPPAASQRPEGHGACVGLQRRRRHTHIRRPAHTCRRRITQAERDRLEAEKAEVRARELERSRCEMKLDKMMKRLTKSLKVRAR